MVRYRHPNDCSHGVIIRAATREVGGGVGIDEQARVYTCTVCGFCFLAAAVTKFKDKPEAIEFFKKQAELLSDQFPKLGPKFIEEAEIKPDYYDNGLQPQKKNHWKIFSKLKK